MLKRLSPAEGEAVPLDSLKADMRIDHDDEDETLGRRLASQTERYEGFTGRILRPGDFEYRTACWRDPLHLPAAPVRSIDTIAYLDADGAEQEVSPTHYYVAETSGGAEIWFKDGFPRPFLASDPDPVIVRFSAGHDLPGASGDSGDPMLAPSATDQETITLMVQWLHERGEPLPDDILRMMAGARRIYR